VCKARRIDCSMGPVIHVRTQGMTANKLAGAPGSLAESHVDSVTCSIVCRLQGLGLAGSFCWVCRNNSDVEL